MKTFPLTRDLVLVGGGHTHALVLRQWGMNPLPGVRLTVINPGPTAPYSGMLPGFVAGHYSRDELDIDLVRLARFAGARLINDYATGINRDAQTVSVDGHPPIAYDVLAIDVGITSAMPQMPGFSAHAIPAKPLGTFASRWDEFRATAQDPQIAIIGGGVAGAELAMAMHHALRDRNPTVRLIDRSRVLSALGYKARSRMMAALTAQKVEIIEDADVSEVFPEGVTLTDGRTIRSDFTTGAAGAKPHDWIATTGLDLHEGFITVDAHLQSNDPNIFAVGDCAHLAFDPRPKAGVYAVREAPVLFDNLRAALSGGALRRYRPQKDYLKLVSMGGKSALAEKFGTAREGPVLWKLKDHIDRKFMDQFDDLPQMAAPHLPKRHAKGLKEALGDKPMCGGCGAKVGRATLETMLVDQFGDDAAMVQPGQVISTDHLRALTLDPVLMTRIAAVHALGDIWAMGATPQAVTASIILPPLSGDLQARTMAEIMQTATDVMAQAGARIVGGHTSLGEELTIGFTLTGLCDKPITLAGARPGDALILTKPIGSGTIMAAEMAGKARGADVMACFAHMIKGQAAASQILRGAHAMTDVTGFGLAGHLRGICDASGVGAALQTDAIPLMDGAAELSAKGIQSSIFDDNVAGAGLIDGETFDLVYDPQTAGGLLAAVASGEAETIIGDLLAAGYPAVVIGEITDASGQILLH
ncbi:selenide, water dikinase SelD [Yoonia sediminilitoris]|uniref:Selenophosphate synthase n=1 Tax=Yoonia sediminilitoris TaxID=1286148 RepID=A0A2T6KPF1_9RHOB|nr:selenide, water dikinase SelD [Yoonia sediminilitoris]PUB18446.1 selenophosphate synthase [Yoonia sediminilitoris]RCW98614.1 selenophosphate synthase [Yoonia sediminilitoris]